LSEIQLDTVEKFANETKTITPLTDRSLLLVIERLRSGLIFIIPRWEDLSCMCASYSQIYCLDLFLTIISNENEWQQASKCKIRKKQNECI
jgi:hypothetical protein